MDDAGSSSLTLHTKYRPKTWDEFVGHKATVKSICSTIGAGQSRAFLLSGPSGCGKTTSARLIARSLDIDPEEDLQSYIEYDGATNTGVDDMRSILDRVRMRPMGGSLNRVVVIDECHMLSTSAWNSALKTVEEPPQGLTWVFCTSELHKVPKAIRTRCQEYSFGPLSNEEIDEVFEFVFTGEKAFPSQPVLDVVVDYAEGSPRKALVALEQVFEMHDGEEAARVLELATAEESKEAIEFCRALNKGTSASRLCKLVGKIDTSAEGVRILVCNYFTKAAMGGQACERALAILRAFGTPYPPGVGKSMYPVLVSIAELFEE